MYDEEQPRDDGDYGDSRQEEAQQESEWQQERIDAWNKKHGKLINGDLEMSLPALSIDVNTLVIYSNFNEYKTAALIQLETINTELNTDEDFVQAKDDISYCKKVMGSIKECKERIIENCGDLNAILKDLDSLKTDFWAIEKLLSDRVITRQDEIKAKLRAVYTKNALDYTNSTKTIYPFKLPLFDPSAKLKGLKTIRSYETKLQESLEEFKSEVYKLSLELNLKSAKFMQWSEGFDYLFPDATKLVQERELEEIEQLCASRIEQAKKAQEICVSRIEKAREQANHVVDTNKIVNSKNSTTHVDMETGEVIDDESVEMLLSALNMISQLAMHRQLSKELLLSKMQQIASIANTAIKECCHE
jgi:hypothetical protein